MASGQLVKDIWPLERATVLLRNRVVLRRWGMQVTVTDDPTSANNTTWVLVKGLSSDDKKDNANWQTITDYAGGGGGGATTPKTAVFAGNAVTTVFTVVETDDIIIANVFQGGQLLIEGTQYTKDNTAKTVTFVSAPPANQHIDITYFAGVSVGGGSGSVAGTWIDCGTWDATGDAIPTTNGTGSGGAIEKGNTFRCSVASTTPGLYNVGTIAVSKQNGPTLASHFSFIGAS